MVHHPGIESLRPSGYHSDHTKTVRKRGGNLAYSFSVGSCEGQTHSIAACYASPYLPECFCKGLLAGGFAIDEVPLAKADEGW